MTSPHEITRLLADWSNGDQQALEKLTPLVYEELRRLAKHYLKQERADHTLQSTALVHEAYLKLVGQHDAQWQNRAQFLAIAARLIRRILVDYARNRYAQKRGADSPKLSLDEGMDLPGGKDLNLVALDDALQALAEFDERQGRIVELRFFAGLSIDETAQLLKVSPATIKREWTSAKAWLFREMTRHSTYAG